MAQNYHSPSVKLAVSAGMAPLSAFSGAISRFQNTEEGRSSTTQIPASENPGLTYRVLFIQPRLA